MWISMRRLAGFSLFCIAIGMFVMLFLSSYVIAVLVIFILMLLGYLLYCS